MTDYIAILLSLVAGITLSHFAAESDPTLREKDMGVYIIRGSLVAWISLLCFFPALLIVTYWKYTLTVLGSAIGIIATLLTFGWASQRLSKYSDY